MATVLTSFITEIDIARLKKEIESLGDIRVVSVKPPNGVLPTTVVLTKRDKTNLTEEQELEAQAIVDSHVNSLDKSAQLTARNKVVIGTIEPGSIEFDNYGCAWKIDQSKNLVPCGTGLRAIGSPTNPVSVIYASEIIGADIGGGGIGGQSVQAVFNEVPIGLINGINAVFFTANSFLAGTTRVFLNGVRLILGQDKGYTETDTNVITLNVVPEPGDELVVDYTPIV